VLQTEKTKSSDYPYKAKLSSQILNVRSLKKVKLNNTSGELKTQIERYNQLRTLRVSNQQEFELAFNKLLVEQRAKLKTYLSKEEVATSILATDANAYDAIIKYQSASNVDLNKKARQSEILALKYITRAATKSSPFAGFGTIAWSADNSNDRRTVVKVNQALLVYIQEVLLNHPIGRSIYKLGLNPSLIQKDSDFEFILNQRNKEQFQKLEVQAILELLMEILSATDSYHDDLIKTLQEKVEADTEGLNSFLEELLAAGFIVLVYPSNREDRNWLDTWVASVDVVEGTELEELKALLNKTKEIETVSVTIANIERMQNLHAEWKAWFQSIDADFTFNLKKERLFYFDSYVAAPIHSGISEASIELAKQLADRLSALNFNEEQVALKRKLEVLTEGKSSISILELYQHYFSGEQLNIEEEVKVFNEAYATIKNKLGELLQTKTSTVELTSESLLNCLPEIENNRVGWPGFIFQVGNGLPYFSSCFIGMGKMMSRFVRSNQKSLAELFAHKIAQEIPNATTISDASAFNPNLKPKLISKSIASLFPDQHSETSYQLSELRVSLSDAGPKLLDQEGNELSFIPYGLEVPERRSPLYRLLSLFAPSYPDIELLRRLINSKTRQEINGLLFTPRVVIDNSLVLQRARWEMEVQAILKKKAGQSMAMYYKELSEWQSEAGLPSEFFFKSRASESNYGKSTKPQYFSINQPILTQLFHHAISKMEGIVIFEEVYPESETYVREIVVE